MRSPEEGDPDRGSSSFSASLCSLARCISYEGHRCRGQAQAEEGRSRQKQAEAGRRRQEEAGRGPKGLRGPEGCRRAGAVQHHNLLKARSRRNPSRSPCPGQREVLV